MDTSNSAVNNCLTSRQDHMAHNHDHHDHHHQFPGADQVEMSRAFTAGIVLNVLFVLVEAFAGFAFDSLALLSDAVHNLADVGTLALSLVAFRLLKVKPTAQYTYGYRKTSILVALFNSVVLLVSIGGITIEAIRHFLHPQEVPGIAISVVAGIGIIINGWTAYLFVGKNQKDVNIQGAYLHMLSDALVSAGVVIGGIAIYFTSWFWIDPLLSLGVAAFILISTWKLLKESLRLSLDGVPRDIEIETIRASAKKINGVMDLHHIHVWALSSNQNAMTAHVVLTDKSTREDENRIKDELKHQLVHQNIQHVTLELEHESEPCESGDC